MKKMIIIVIVAFGCVNNDSQRSRECNNPDLVEIDFYSKEKLSISLPRVWKIVDTTIWSPSDPCFYWRVFASKDSSGFAFLSVSNIKNMPMRKDIQSLKERFQKWAYSNEKTTDVIISQDDFFSDEWAVVTRKAFRKRENVKTLGQIVALKDTILFEFFIESKNVEDVNCSMRSFSLLKK